MSEAVRKGKLLGTVLWYALMGIPVAAGGYLIYEKQRKLGVDDAPPRAAAVAEDQAAGAPTTVAVAPRFADPEMLKQKQEQDALLRRDFELRLARERESLGTGSGPSTRPAKGRVITLGPSANPEKPVEDPNAAYERAAADAAAAREEAARKARGPQVHEVAEDYRDSQRRREAELRQQGVQTNTRAPETPLLPFSGTGTGSYESSSSRPRSASRR